MTRYRISGDRRHPLIDALLTLKGKEKEMIKTVIEIIPNDGYSLDVSVSPKSEDRKYLEEACRQWCDFIDEAPERKNGIGFADFYEEIKRQMTEFSYQCCLHDSPRTLDWCEDNCSKYYRCDTVAMANDELKEMEGEN